MALKTNSQNLHNYLYNANAFNLFDFFALNSKVESTSPQSKNSVIIGGRNLTSIKQIMNKCEKYSTALSNQTEFEKFFNIKNKTTKTSLTDVAKSVYAGVDLSKTNKSLTTMQQDINEIDVLLNKTEDDGLSFQKFVKGYFSICKDEQNKTSEYSVASAKEINKVCKRFPGLKNRAIVSFENKTYVLPEFVGKQELKISTNIDLNSCPCLEDDFKNDIDSLQTIKLQKADKAEIDFENSVLEKFVKDCSKIKICEKTKKQKNISSNEFYSAKFGKTFVQNEVVENKKTRQVFGIEKIVRALYSVIDSQTPKRFLNPYNRQILEISKLRTLEFMIRGISGLGLERANKISKEIENTIIKKSILINAEDVPVFDAVSQSTHIAGITFKNTCANLGLDALALPQIHKENGFNYENNAVGDISLAKWFATPLKEDNKSQKVNVRISKKECNKILSLNKFMSFKQFANSKEKWQKQISFDDIKKCYDKDGCVGLSENVNNQLDLLFEFSKINNYGEKLKNLLADSSAQIVALLEKDEFLQVLNLIDANTKASTIDLSKGDLLKNKTKIMETITEQKINTSKEKTTKINEVVIDKKLQSYKAMQNNLDFEKQSVVCSHQLDKLSVLMAEKIDYSLVRANLKYCYKSKKQKFNYLIQDVVSGDSTLKEDISYVFKHDGNLNEIGKVLKKRIDCSNKQVLDDVVNDVLKTGYSKQFEESEFYDVKNSKKAVKKIAVASSMPADNVLTGIDFDFSKKELESKLSFLKNGKEIDDLLEDRIDAYSRAKAVFEDSASTIEEKKEAIALIDSVEKKGIKPKEYVLKMTFEI